MCVCVCVLSPVPSLNRGNRQLRIKGLPDFWVEQPHILLKPLTLYVCDALVTYICNRTKCRLGPSQHAGCVLRIWVVEFVIYEG